MEIYWRNILKSDLCKYLSIEEKNKNNGVVNIEIRALDKKTNETKVLPIEMTQMDNKMWRITGYDYKTYSLPYDGFDRI